MKVAPYGSWLSPISADLITKSTIGLSQILLDGTDLYWVEQRPLDGGRNVIVCRDAAGKMFDVTPPPFSARTRAHEYGGGAYSVDEGTIYFCNDKDQRIYRQAKSGQPQALTAEAGAHYADIIVDRKRQRLICVQEDHSIKGEEPITTLASISLKDGTVDMLVAGNDFYSTPRLNSAGTFLSWMSWSHPNMPWDESFVWMANVGADGSLANIRKIAGGPGESIFQPQWSPGGELYYVSDRSGWWNIYRHSDYEETMPMAAAAAEFGLPQWVFGMSTYAFESDERIICTFCDSGTWRLGAIDTSNGTMEKFDLPYTNLNSIQASTSIPGKVYFLAGSPTQSTALTELSVDGKQCKTIKRSSDLDLSSGYLSQPETIQYQTTGGKIAYAFFYAPHNQDFSSASGELPPLLVKSHGGPTSAASSTLNLNIQYWTSRGFGVVDVNYGGSTGFGREYRNRLYDTWGIVDVEDCINAAKYLVAQKRVDKNKLAIAGGSAGGYTTLCALTFHDTFKAGASYYGVSDLTALATDTHKFEARYLDRLIGPYPEAKQTYFDRSPINFAQKLHCPVIFMQGLEDKVVPPGQSEKMVTALRNNGVPVAYLTFEGEQHGFRKSENIKRALDAELYFYAQIFGFDLPEVVEKVHIENLDKLSNQMAQR